jgi:hypothetical protein
MREAGDKPRRLLRLRTVIQACPADAPPAPLPEGFFLPRIPIRSAADVAAIAKFEELVQTAKLMAKRKPRKPQKPRKLKGNRKQAKPAVDKIIAKLKAMFPPHGKPPREMSTSELHRQLPPDVRGSWSSVKRARLCVLKK